MARTVLQRSRIALFIAVLVLATASVFSPCALAYTPTDPVVKQMVARGATFLESNPAELLGGKAVAALALVKADKPWDNPVIVSTAEAIKAKIDAAGGDTDSLVIDNKENDNYAIATSAIFLLSYDPGTYRNEIQFLLDVLAYRQKEHGAWGYMSKETGDTSMTQYAVLTMWEAHQENFNIPSEMVDGVATWLARTQDPNGGFGYQGKISPSFEPVRQYEIRLSMVAAGLGSMYICSDLAGLGRKTKEERQEELSALQAVEDASAQDAAGQSNRPKKISISLEASVMRNVQNRGNGWMQQHYTIAPFDVHFKYYYLYSLERYCSFRELFEGKSDRKEGTKWYNDGVEYLSKMQAEDGRWQSKTREASDAVTTGFAMLFLLRSTKKSIQRDRGFGPGTLVGGRGFPKEGDVVIRNGQVIAKPTTTPFEDMRKAMQNPGETDLAGAISRMDELGPKQSQVLVSQYAEKLRALVSDPSTDNRIAAVKALGLSGNLENAPILILALDDEDSGVVLEARDGLRRISRKIGGFGLPDEYNPSQHSQAVKNWRQWYKELQPEAEF